MAKKTQETQPINPFCSDLQIETYWKVVSVTGSENHGGSVTWRKLEQEDKISLYTDHIFKVFLKLSSSGRLLFMYIASHLGYEKDSIELAPDKLMEVTELGKTAVYEALKNLQVYAVIAEKKTRKNMYWVNPMLMFRGDRLKRYPNNVVEPKTSPKMPNLSSGSEPLDPSSE